MQCRGEFGIGLGASGAIYGEPVFFPPRRPEPRGLDYLRRDEAELRTLGNDSVVGGLNRLGDLGYELTAVTSVLGTGTTASHVFQRRTRGGAGGRTRYEFQRLDDG